MMRGYLRELAVRAAESILERGGWCVLEACVDVPSQRWQARLVIFDLTAERVAEVVREEITLEPALDHRLSGCDRHALRADPSMGAHVCYLGAAAPADAPPPQGQPASSQG